jgi:hypothetical protein
MFPKTANSSKPKLIGGREKMAEHETSYNMMAYMFDGEDLPIEIVEFISQDKPIQSFAIRSLFNRTSSGEMQLYKETSERLEALGINIAYTGLVAGMAQDKARRDYEEDRVW